MNLMEILKANGVEDDVITKITADTGWVLLDKKLIDNFRYT